MNVIQKLSVTNFRCHDSFETTFLEPTTLIIGPNGSGKTSLIEAIYITLRGKSFKTTDQNIIQKEKDFYRIQVDLSDSTSRTVIYHKPQNKKEFHIGDKKSLRLPAKNRLPIVLFEPNHLNIIHNSPSKRRDFIDNLISQIDPIYHQALGKYEKSLKQRNTLLKSDYATKEKVFPWDIILAKYGSEIVLKRKYYIDQINQNITTTYNSIANRPDKIHLNYESKLFDESNFLKSLEKTFQYDLVTKSTSSGPHRDDIIFNFNNHLAINTASRGELRSIILALKFIESQIIRDQLNTNPIILLDDIFSELDEDHQKHLSNNFKSHQIIITSVNLPSKKLTQSSIIKIPPSKTSPN